MAQAILLVLLGLAAALLHTALKLRLGIPGHAAILWLVPLLVGRRLTTLAPAGSVASTSLAAGLFAFGGFSLHWPLVLSFGTFWLVGPVLDLYWLFVTGSPTGEEKGTFSFSAQQPSAPVAGEKVNVPSSSPGWWRLLVVPMAGVVGNLAHLGWKLAFGVMRSHGSGVGMPGWLYELLCYVAFGLAAGILGYCLLLPFTKKRGHSPFLRSSPRRPWRAKR